MVTQQKKVVLVDNTHEKEALEMGASKYFIKNNTSLSQLVQKNQVCYLNAASSESIGYCLDSSIS